MNWGKVMKIESESKPGKSTRARLQQSISAAYAAALLSLGLAFLPERLSPAYAATADNGMAVLQASKPLIARSGAWQSYHDHLDIKSGLETRPLFITFTNGADGRPKLTDVQVELGGKPFLSIKDFDAAGSATKQLTGLAAGSSSLVVKVFGPSGARLSWSLRTEPVVITSVSPNPLGPSDKVVIQGKNFSTRTAAGANKVFIAGHAATVVSATNTQLQIKPPAGLSAGGHGLVVVADSVKSAPFKVATWAAPKLNELDFLAGPPGQPVVISGSGFSINAADNVVKFGTVKAQVTWASETQIGCVVPDMHFPNWHVPVTVTTHGLQSKEKLPLHVDMRVILNEGVPMH